MRTPGRAGKEGTAGCRARHQMRVKKGQLDSVDDGLDRSGTTRLLHISSAS
jgi:hypothetical protein